MKYSLIFIIILSSFISPSQTLNYNKYHRNINKAEIFFYLDNNVDSCIYYYDKTFEEFKDYIFLRDIINIIQIAYYSKKPYKKYIKKGFRFGLKLEHLKTIPLLSKIYNALTKDNSLLSYYKREREQYLKSINFDYLIKIYKLALQDQVDKNTKEYGKISTSNIILLKNYTKKYGFPGSKILGIGDSHIFSEVRTEYYDIDNLSKRYNVPYYHADDYILASKYALIVLVHNSCAFTELEKTFKLAITKGEIHPREVGLLYDNIYRKVFSNGKTCKMPKLENGLFLLNSFTNYYLLGVSLEAVNIKNKELNRPIIRVDKRDKSKYISINDINKKRKEWGIAPLEVDIKKKIFEEKYKFKLFWGFWSSL